MTEQQEKKIIEIIEEEYGFCEKIGGQYVYTIYADYRDEMDVKSAEKILCSEDPEQAFDEQLEEWYWESAVYYERELIDKVMERIGYQVDYDEAVELIRETIYFEYPREHFLKQTFKVDIYLDTGDCNYDFTLNTPYHCLDEKNPQPFDNKASIVWLAKQQGYKKGEFQKAMSRGDSGLDGNFLTSVRRELANHPSSMATLTFLVEMTFEQLMELHRLIHLKDRNGHNYDASKNPYCGYIVLDKKTMTGLFDPWYGGGSLFEIELKNDVRIPIRYIWGALPDGAHDYNVGEVYGMCGWAWKDTVKQIHAPLKVS